MSQPLVGFLRGAGYALLASLAAYISTNLGASGLVSTSTAAIIVAIIGSIEHYLNAPSAPQA